MKLLTLLVAISIFTVIEVDAQNIMISNTANPCEPSIMLDPKNPNILVAGAVLNSYYISNDTGRNWSQQTLSSTFGVWGDPVISVDTFGHFYYFHLSNPPQGNWIDRIVCQKSIDKGRSWNNGSFTGLNGAKAQDKHWCAIDRSNNMIYLSWTQFDKYGSSNPNDSSIILFSKSNDLGESWSKPLRINKFAGDCIDKDNTVEGAVPAIGPNGEIFVSWTGPKGIVFNKSKDQGDTWLKEEIPVDPMPGGWDITVSGIGRCNGLPVTSCDISNGPHRGTIYINWADQRNGESNTDIFLSKSTDGGMTWTAPVRVNDDNSAKHQFFTWMTIDQTNGYLYFVFYDRRNYSNDSTDVYMAVSKDGGNTFINKRISQSPFYPTGQVFFGDYNNIVAHNDIVRPIWTRLHNGQLSIWTDVTPVKDLFTGNHSPQKQNEILEFENFPNPSSNYTFFSFSLHKHATVKLDIIDTKGKVISSIIKNEKRNAGKYVERIALEELNITEGVYYFKLQIDKRVKVKKQIIIKK